MSDQTPATITVELRPAQRAAYLYDWQHHTESDDTEAADLYDEIAGAPLVTLTDEDGKRRRRHVLTLTRTQACDLLTNIDAAIMLNGDADERDDPQAEGRMRHHTSAYTAVRAAGAETVREFNQRTERAAAERREEEPPADADAPAEYHGDPYELPIRRVSRRMETDALHQTRLRVELSVRRDQAGWVVHLDADDAEMELYREQTHALHAYEARVLMCQRDYARHGEYAWTETDVPGVPVAPGPVLR